MHFKVKKIFPIILLLTSCTFYLLIFYNSEIIWDGVKKEYYKNYYLISIIMIILSITTFVFNKKYLLYTFTFVSCFVVALYLNETYLHFKHNNIYKNNKNINYSFGKKIQYYRDLKKEDKNTVVAVYPPNHFSNKNLKMLPLSGVANSRTVHCNESGYYSVYQSDRYGFNNPDSEWNKNDIEYFLIGDSYVHGACVNRPNDISSNLRKISKKNVLNAGMSSSGTLIHYASLKEYLPQNTKKVLWFIYEGNDLKNLNTEIKNPTLFRYFSDYNFLQNLKDKQNLIDKISLNLIEKKYKKEINDQKTQFFKLFRTRQKILHKTQENKTKIDHSKLVNFEKIFKQGIQFTRENKSKMYVICLPAFERYFFEKKFETCNQIKKIVSKFNVAFFDIHNEVISKEKDIKRLFPPWLGYQVHYNKNGYELISKAVYKFTLSN